MSVRLAALFALTLTAQAGGFSCSATCLSKVASGVSIAANGRTIWGWMHKIPHPHPKKGH